MRFLILAFTLARAAGLPLHFEPNRGQISGRTEWIAGITGAQIFLAPGEAKFGDVRMRLVGSRRKTRFEGLEPTGGYSSYFIGRDEKHWVTGVPHFARVKQPDIYPGIDVIYYASGARLEYDFVLRPGADPRCIELAFDKPVRVDTNGDLVLGGGNRQHRPRVFQAGREIPAEYRISSRGHVEFAIAPYDVSRPLTIDPVVEFATYLGGPGSEILRKIALDSTGNIVVTGSTQSPASQGLDPFQQPNTVDSNPFVMKLTPDARKLLFYASIQTSRSSFASGLGIDSKGNIVLTGTTNDPAFPTKNAFQTAYVATNGASFVTKLTADARSMVFSTLLNGSGRQLSGAVVIMPDDSIYVGGNTTATDFPIKNPLQSTNAGNQDGYIVRFSPAGDLQFSTYFGSSGGDTLSGPILSRDGSLLFTGSVGIADLPLKDAMQTSASPGNFGAPFFMRMSGDGKTILQSTYVGGESFSGSGGGLAEDDAGNIYLATRAFNAFLSLKNAYQSSWTQDLSSALLKLDSTGKNVIFATYFSGLIAGVRADRNQNVYLTGTAYFPDLPLKDSLYEFDGRSAGFLTKFTPSGQALSFSTLLGGKSSGSGAFLLDGQGGIYVTGTTAGNLTVKDAYQPNFGGGGDAFLVKLIDNSVTPVSSITTSPSRVSFQFVQGGDLPGGQTVNVSAPEPYFLTSSPSWISAQPVGSPSALTKLSIIVDPRGFAPGTYSGSVVLHPQSGGTVASIEVSLTVLGTPAVITSIDPATVPTGSNDTAITVHGSGFNTGASLFINGIGYPEITIRVVDSTTARFTIPKALLAGETAYAITIQNPTAPQSNAGMLEVATRGPVIRAVQNAASYVPPPVAPGEIVTIYGSGFGTIETTRVLFDNVVATLIYVTPTQLAATVPPAGSSGQKTSVTVSANQVVSSPISLAVQPSSPGLFTVNASGSGQASALNQDYSINASSNPAERGSVIQLFGTGGGILTRDELPRVTLPISATVDGIDAVVQYAGAAPGLPEGVLQVNVFISAAVRSGAVPVTIKIGDAVSNTVSIATK